MKKLLLTLALLPSALFAWDRTHSTIAARAYALLPAEDRAYIADEKEMRAFIDHHTLIPDIVDRPDGTEHYVWDYCGTDKVDYSAAFGQFHLWKTAPEVADFIGWYLPETVNALRERRIHDFACLAGCLSHALGDWTCPPHANDGDVHFVRYRMANPPPANFDTILKGRSMHQLLENVEIDLSDVSYSPRILGETLPEAERVLAAEAAASHAEVRELIGPMVKCAYAGDTNGLYRIQKKCAVFGTRLVADTLHTLCALSRPSAGPGVSDALTCGEMACATPESQGVPSEAILKFIDACEKMFDAGKAGALHGFVILRHGRTIAEGSWKPFDTLNETHMLYSHSKSFTSSAIGFLVDEGKLDLDERLVDIFSEDVPEKPDPLLGEIRVRDLLTMNVGADRDHTVARKPKDWTKEFMKKTIERRPGTGFKYDSDATYMLAAIVEKKSGMKLMDYLKVKMFDPIGITEAWSTVSPEGIACGGWGMNMTTRELARFGQLYLNRGTWNGRRILSPDWVALATTRQTWSGWQNVGVKALGEGTDWEQGYGFQFWRCRHGAFRADGAGG